MDLSALSAEFPRNAVHWRPQGTPYERNGSFFCMALAYIDARDVMDRLDAVCGPDRWQSEFCETPKGRMICRIGILTDNGWVWKGDGAGDTDVEGEKGGISDSLKRAAVSWGIGRYLYRLKSPWVGCAVNQKNGKTYWKSWSEDPWAKVQSPDATRPQPNPQQQGKQAKQSPEPPTYQKMLGGLKEAGMRAANDPRFAADLEALRKDRPDLAAHVDVEIGKLREAAA